MKVIKKQSKILKLIVWLINILCFLQALATAISLVLIPFLPPYFKFNFSVKADGVLDSISGGEFPFAIPEVVGFAFFAENFEPNYWMNSCWFLLSLITLFILFQFKDFVNSVVEDKAFSPRNHQRFRYMAIAFFIALIIESITFLFVEIPMAKLIQHDALTVNASYSFTQNFNWNICFLGLTFLVLSEAFREGFSLKQESELTI